MNREEQQATLILRGWRAVTVHSGLTGWGISHSEFGSITEDVWHKTMGPSRAPLKATPFAIHEQEPRRECEWDTIPDLCFSRLWDAVGMGVWSGS